MGVDAVPAGRFHVDHRDGVRPDLEVEYEVAAADHVGMILGMVADRPLQHPNQAAAQGDVLGEGREPGPQLSIAGLEGPGPNQEHFAAQLFPQIAQQHQIFIVDGLGPFLHHLFRHLLGEKLHGRRHVQAAALGLTFYEILGENPLHLVLVAKPHDLLASPVLRLDPSRNRELRMQGKGQLRHHQ